MQTAGGELALRRRGPRDFLILLAGRVIMTSAAHHSEVALAEAACADLRAAAPRVLVSGLGMGYTLRAALDALPSAARVVVGELEPAVVRWCRGPLAPLCDAALDDSRVEVALGDVAGVLAAAAAGTRARFHAVALDLFEGPRGTRAEDSHPLWGRAALESVREALEPSGVLAIWSEDHVPPFVRRLTKSGFDVQVRREGRGGRRHALYRATPASAGGRARRLRR